MLCKSRRTQQSKNHQLMKEIIKCDIYIQIQYYLEIKKKQTHGTTQRNPENRMLNERSQSQKSQSMILFK